MIGRVLRLTMRALTLQRRTLALVAIAVAPVLMALAYSMHGTQDVSRHDFYSSLLQQLTVPIVTALVSLVFGVSAFGDEREDGTILYLTATPQPRLGLTAAKIAAAWLASLCLLVPSLLISAALALGSQADASLLLWPLAGVAVASLAYCAASVLLSMYARRPIVFGILYILLWEGSIATYAASAAKLSIAAYGRALVAQAVPQAAKPVAGPGTSVVVLAIVVALTGGATARALRRVDLP
jgi:ABC-2 type transport system permease protein